MNHKFVKFIPNRLEDDIIYVSLDYGTVVHNCCCGCGNNVVTPLSPTDWKLTFDGDSVSLYPSISNWSFDCKSHYWIKRNKIIWAEKWTDERIRLNRMQDQLKKKKHFFNKTINIKNNNNSNRVQPLIKKIKQKIFSLFNLKS